MEKINSPVRTLSILCIVQVQSEHIGVDHSGECRVLMRERNYHPSVQPIKEDKEVQRSELS